MVRVLEKEFLSKEHDVLGKIKLMGLDASFKTFHFASGANLTFGEIILLAGDYVGISLQPISLAMGEAKKKKRFLAAYEQLATCPPDKLYRVVHEMHADDIHGGITFKDLDGEYLMLAVHNIDHFGDYAIDAFATGYTLAMEAAVSAFKIKDQNEKLKKLEYAYSLLGYAAHFLTDRFSSGHMRTPRLELDQKFSPEVGSLLSFFQHNEDGDMGLLVETHDATDKKKIATWMAYGDGHLDDENNAECKMHVLSTVQAAADEVYQAYLTGLPTLFNDSRVSTMIPKVAENNHPPMFKIDEQGDLLCRVPVSEIKDEYALMTRTKAVEILLYHGAKYAGNAIKSKVNELINYLNIQEAKNTKQCNILSKLSFLLSCFKSKENNSEPVAKRASIGGVMRMNQSQLLIKLNEYLKNQGRTLRLQGGYCHGLTLLWLYKMSTHQEDWFYDVINHVLKNSKLEENKGIEKLISYIEWLQHSSQYMMHVNQLDLEILLELKKEKSISFVFYENEIEEVLALVLEDNKLISISSGDHTVGVFKKNNQIYFFDTNESIVDTKIIHDACSLKNNLIYALFRRYYVGHAGLPLEVNVLSHQVNQSRFNHANFYRTLIQKRSDLSQAGLGGVTNLQLACDSGDEILALELLKFGASPQYAAKQDMTPLNIAKTRGYQSIVELLIKYGAISELPKGGVCVIQNPSLGYNNKIGD